MERQIGVAALFDTLIADFEARELPVLTSRSKELPELPGKADVVIGMRRTGKTWFVFQQIQKRLAEGVGYDRLLYLNFEDERLLPLEGGELHHIPEAFYRRHPSSRGKRCWFYFDEIQNVAGWETFIRRLLDTENVAIVLTGSSAKLLSSEIASSLRGRSLTTELLPFSFGEALRHSEIDVPKRWPPGAAQRSLLASQFDSYLEVGGFPEVQNVGKDLRLRILRDYVDVVLLRDVAERHEVENLTALRYLQRRLLAGPGGRFSLHRLYNDLKSQGLRVGKNTLYRYLDHLEDAYLIFTITVASPSVRVRQTNPRKCYAVDPSMASVVSFKASREIGGRLENAVYLELRRRGYDLAYFLTSSGLEIDFLAEHPMHPTQLVQVSAEVADAATRKRETRALQQAMRETEIDRAVLVTLREEGDVELESGSVRVVPAWRWFLEGPPSLETSA